MLSILMLNCGALALSYLCLAGGLVLDVFSVEPLGDIDCDGVDDIAIGCPAFGGEEGAVWIVSIKEMAVLQEYHGRAPGERLGCDISCGTIGASDTLAAVVLGGEESNATLLVFVIGDDRPFAEVPIGGFVSSGGAPPSIEYLGSGSEQSFYLVASRNGRPGIVSVSADNGSSTEPIAIGEEWSVQSWTGLSDCDDDGIGDAAIWLRARGKSGTSRVIWVSGRSGHIISQQSVDSRPAPLVMADGSHVVLDYNCDGTSDLVVGAGQSWKSSRPGTVDVISGVDGSSILQLSGSPMPSLGEARANYSYGTSVSAVPCSHGACIDILIGVPFYYRIATSKELSVLPEAEFIGIARDGVGEIIRAEMMPGAVELRCAVGGGVRRLGHTNGELYGARVVGLSDYDSDGVWDFGICTGRYPRGDDVEARPLRLDVVSSASNSLIMSFEITANDLVLISGE